MDPTCPIIITIINTSFFHSPFRQKTSKCVLNRKDQCCYSHHLSKSAPRQGQH